MTAPGQLHGLTMARGFAAWMVVLYHVRSGMPWLPDRVMAVLGKGYLAVDFFFLLSGFVIYLTAHDAFREQGVAALPAFLRRRAARIYPLYAVMLGLTVAFAALLTATGRDTGGYPWGELPLHAAMLQNWGFTGALTWNHPAWSISTEFAAYLLFPLIVIATPIERMPRWALTVAIIALIMAMAAWLHAVGLSSLDENIPRFGIVRCLFEFAAGCLLCALWLRGRGQANRLPTCAAMLALTAAILLWSRNGARELWAFPAIAAAAIYLLAEASDKGWSRTAPSPIYSPLLYLGEISYATYLCHFMLFIWFKIAMVDDPHDISPARIALFLALTFAASVLLHHGVERPGRRLAGPRRAVLCPPDHFRDGRQQPPAQKIF